MAQIPCRTGLDLTPFLFALSPFFSSDPFLFFFLPYFETINMLWQTKPICEFLIGTTLAGDTRFRSINAMTDCSRPCDEFHMICRSELRVTDFNAVRKQFFQHIDPIRMYLLFGVFDLPYTLNKQSVTHDVFS